MAAVRYFATGYPTQPEMLRFLYRNLLVMQWLLWT